MSTIKQTAEGKNFTAINVGKLSGVLDKSDGKIFLKEHIQSSGSEVSISVLPPNTDLPIFHFHKQNEEIYIILAGEGKFQIDHSLFDISEGSIIRVAPAGLRGMTNLSDTPMIYIVIQAKENSLEQYTMEDGGIADIKPLW